jgi:DNA processing protein
MTLEISPTYAVTQAAVPDVAAKLPWLALRSIPGVGLVLFQRLAAAFGEPRRVFQAQVHELTSVKGVTPALAQAIFGFRNWDRLEAELFRLQSLGLRLVTADDPAFPVRLHDIPYPPPFLFVKGNLPIASGPTVALVGTRQASYYGLKMSRRLARELAEAGVTVISGLARGIDTAAHAGALEAGGATVAVLGCGLDVVYPPENKEYYQKIPQSGALVSEFSLGTPPESRNFPRRNRLISGLSQAVVVVEAGVQSGTSITVRCALDQGREVMAVPGPADSPTSRGPHRLIQEGAKLVQEAADILAELPAWGAAGQGAGGDRGGGGGPRGAPPGPARRLSRADDPLLPFLGAEPVQLEELVTISRLPAPEVMSRLTLLELQGLIRELPGKCYVLEG